MAGLMSRAATIIKAKISALLNRAENPSETLDYSYERQLESLQNVKRGVANVVTAKKRLQLQTQQLEKLVANQQQLQSRIEQFRSQKEVIKAQYSAAEAQVRIGEAATGIGRQMEDTGLAIQRAKDKTEQMQARADALDELVQTGALEDMTSDQSSLDRELAQLSSQSQVDQELAKLKAEVGPGSSEGDQKQIEAPETPPAN